MKTEIMSSPENDMTVDRLKADIAQERQMIEMLQQSYDELMLTVQELDNRIEGLDDENNEWKTRFETQMEINQKLERQNILYHNKIDDAKMAFKDGKVPKSTRINNDDEPSRIMLKQKEKEKSGLQKLLRDIEWRLDQESKAYHKANEERKQHQAEINGIKDAINDIKNRQKQVVQHQADNLGTTPRVGNNIPADQRILDPKKGPIKKTAAIKNLPKME